MAAARELLSREVEVVRRGMNQAQLGPGDYMAAWESVARDIIYVPAQQRYVRAASATNADRVASMQVGAARAGRGAWALRWWWKVGWAGGVGWGWGGVKLEEEPP